MPSPSKHNTPTSNAVPRDDGWKTMFPRKSTAKSQERRTPGLRRHLVDSDGESPVYNKNVAIQASDSNGESQVCNKNAAATNLNDRQDCFQCAASVITATIPKALHTVTARCALGQRILQGGMFRRENMDCGTSRRLEKIERELILEATACRRRWKVGQSHR